MPASPEVETRDGPTPASGANKDAALSELENSIQESLRKLYESSTEDDLKSSSTLISGALTLALAYTNKANVALLTSKGGADAAHSNNTLSSASTTYTIHARILVISVSDSSPDQYISTMNAIFAAAYARVVIDVLALRGDNKSSFGGRKSSPKPLETEQNGESAAADVLPSSSGAGGRTTFLQQAADLTGGTYLSVPTETDVAGLLTYLLFGFSDADARPAMVAPTQSTVDFRAACFCHRQVIATGFVCSICLSIFCSPPMSSKSSFPPNNEGPVTSAPSAGPGVGMRAGTPGGTTLVENSPGSTVECLTCGSRLILGFYGDRPAVVPRRKRKRKRTAAAAAAINGGSGREDSCSIAGTPRPG